MSVSLDDNTDGRKPQPEIPPAGKLEPWGPPSGLDPAVLQRAPGWRNPIMDD